MDGVRFGDEALALDLETVGTALVLSSRLLFAFNIFLSLANVQLRDKRVNPGLRLVSYALFFRPNRRHGG